MTMWLLAALIADAEQRVQIRKSLAEGLRHQGRDPYLVGYNQGYVDALVSVQKSLERRREEYDNAENWH